jgi:uncharacterized protein YggE
MSCRVLAVMLLALLVAPAARGQSPAPNPPEIVVSGEGMRSVTADRASVIISVETRARTPTEAGALNATRNSAIRAAVAGLGIPRDDIATYGYTMYAVRQEPPYMRDTGFVATNSLRVTLRRPEQLGLLGRVIDTALTAGATHIAGVHHEARQTDQAEREALAAAVADARTRAETAARAAGGSVGELIQVSVGGAAVVPTSGMDFAGGMAMRAAARARAQAMVPTSITSGEIEVRQFVTVRWRFVPGAR